MNYHFDKVRPLLPSSLKLVDQIDSRMLVCSLENEDKAPRDEAGPTAIHSKQRRSVKQITPDQTASKHKEHISAQSRCTSEIPNSCTSKIVADPIEYLINAGKDAT